VPALWSPYGGAQPRWSGYSMANAASPMGSYAQVASAYGQPSPSGSVLMRLIGEFARVLRARIVDLEPDLIHAHDWVTFAAAEAASKATGVPWLAHVHSTEAERRPGAPDPIIERTETRGLRNTRATSARWPQPSPASSPTGRTGRISSRRSGKSAPPTRGGTIRSGSPQSGTRRLARLGRRALSTALRGDLSAWRRGYQGSPFPDGDGRLTPLRRLACPPNP